MPGVPVFDALIAHIDEAAPDFVVMAPRSELSLGAAAAGTSVTERVIKKCKCNFILVKY